MINGTKSFGDFNYEDSKAYEKRLLILLLKLKLEKNEELKPEDIPESYEQCKMFVSQDMEFLARNRCPLLKPGEKTGDPLSCRLKQLEDVGDIKLAATALANKIKPCLVDMICGHSNVTDRLIVKDRLVKIFELQLQCLEIRFGDISTFLGMLEELIGEMTAVDETMCGENAKLKPVFDSFLKEMEPKIDSKLKKYYIYETLDCGQCPYCRYPWVEISNEIEQDFLEEPFFDTAEKLEIFCAVSFKKTVYRELTEFVKKVPIEIE